MFAGDLLGDQFADAMHDKVNTRREFGFDPAADLKTPSVWQMMQATRRRAFRDRYREPAPLVEPLADDDGEVA